MRYAFWNNKGGTGKTSLAFQSVVEFAIKKPEAKILVVDLCPQANLSELFLGGLLGNGGENLAEIYNLTPRKSIGGYFQRRLNDPYNVPTIEHTEYIVWPHDYNQNIPENIDLVAGDRIVELLVNAISALSITQIPGINTWIRIIDWLNDFFNTFPEEQNYDYIFIDTNPSFSIYTQIALASAERLIVPVMADDSSRRALRNVYSLIYGAYLPDAVYDQYSFHTKIQDAGRTMPKIHIIAKNRLTQYVVPASAYSSVLKAIDTDVHTVIAQHPEIFTFAEPEEGIANIRDFQTTGVVAFAKAMPFSLLTKGNHDIFGTTTTVRQDYLDNCIEAIHSLVDMID